MAKKATKPSRTVKPRTASAGGAGAVPEPRDPPKDPPGDASRPAPAGGALLRGRFEGKVHPALDAINRSFPVDRRLWREDLRGSIAHAQMLGATGILEPAAVARIVEGL